MLIDYCCVCIVWRFVCVRCLLVVVCSFVVCCMVLFVARGCSSFVVCCLLCLASCYLLVVSYLLVVV